MFLCKNALDLLFPSSTVETFYHQHEYEEENKAQEQYAQSFPKLGGFRAVVYSINRQFSSDERDWAWLGTITTETNSVIFHALSPVKQSANHCFSPDIFSFFIRTKNDPSEYFCWHKESRNFVTCVFFPIGLK